MYDQTTRRQIIDNAVQDLARAIRTGDPHRIAKSRNAAANAYIAASQYNSREAGELRRALNAPIILITYNKDTGEATIARRDPATGRKYETRGNYLDQEETRWTATAERTDTPYHVIWTPARQGGANQ